MRGKYLRRVGGFFLAALMLAGVGLMSMATAEAQGRRRIIVARPAPYRVYDPFGYNRWGYDRFGYDRWGNRWGDPLSPYGNDFNQYVFKNSDVATNQSYKDGYRTGKDDGKKAKSFDPQRSHFYHDSGFGNFAEVYRSGFSRGYQEGYRDGRAG
jgi:hypothetical protein